MEILLHDVYKPYLRLPDLRNLTYFSCCVKFFRLFLVSYIANYYDSNNENIVP